MRMSSFAEKGWLGLALSIPLLLVLLICPYFVPGPDESFQMQAATQMRIGNGYVSAANAEPKSLDEAGLTRVLGWPIAYSFSLSTLERIGFSPSVAAKSFEIFVIIAGLLAWTWLLRVCGLAPPLAALFLPLLWLQFLSWGIYSTNAFTWAFLPLMLGIGIRVHRGMTPALGAGLVCALLVVFRYQNIVLIPAGALAILLSVPSSFFRRLGLAAVFCFPPTFCFLLIFLSNKASSGGQHGTFLTQIPMLIGWEWRWIADFFAAFFLGASFRLDEVIVSLAQKAGLGAYGAWLKYTVAFSFGGIFFVGLFRGFSRDYSGEQRHLPLFYWVMLSLAGLVGMLFLLNIVWHVDNIPIGRYYHPFLPAVTLMLLLYGQPAALVVLQRFSPRRQELFVVLTVLLCFLVSGAFSLYRFRLSRAFEARAEIASGLVASARAENASIRVLVFADQLFPHFAPRDDMSVLVYPETLRKNTSPLPTSPVIVFLVHDENNPKPQFPPIHDIRELASRNGMKLSEKDGIVVAWKVFGVAP